MEAIQKPVITQGWLRAIIYLAGVSLIVFFVQTYGSGLVSSLVNTTQNEIVEFGILYAIMGTAIFAFTWIMRKIIDRKSFATLGFTWKGYSNEAYLGFFGALAMLGIGSLILVATGYVSFIGASFHASDLFIEIMIMISVAFVEELLFRGYLLNNLMQSLNKWIALVISAILFAVFHVTNPDVTFFAILNILLAGVLLGLNYIFTKNLWFGFFFHFAWNYFQGPVLGYDVSGLKLTSLVQQSVSGPEAWTGGAFGFEGSLLCPLLFVVAIAIFAYFFLKRYQTIIS